MTQWTGFIYKAQGWDQRLAVVNAVMNLLSQLIVGEFSANWSAISFWRSPLSVSITQLQSTLHYTKLSRHCYTTVFFLKLFCSAALLVSTWRFISSSRVWCIYERRRVGVQCNDNWLMFCRKIRGICCEQHTKHINTLRGEVHNSAQSQ